MQFESPQGQQRYAEVVDAAAELVIGADFDGTLSPIVDDPTQARIHPRIPAVLADLARRVLAIAVVTGRPAEQVLELGRLEEVAGAADSGARLLVLGQYGNQRWDSAERRVVSPEPPPTLAQFRELVPRLLEEADAAEAWLEDKGLAVALHTRRLPDPAAAFERLLPVVRTAAESLGLGVEPGRNVVEVRAPGMHKGLAVHALAEELPARAFLFIGDDLGDLEAFRAVAELRERGTTGLLVCSASTEQQALAELADVVVDGPDGVADFLEQLAEDLSSR